MDPLILYVDDEQPNLDLFRRTLDDELPILTASTAEQAYKILDQEEVAVLVSDHRMPEVTGVELLGNAAKRWPHVSRILLTAYSDRELLLAAIRDGRVNDYILKPWVLDDLRLRLQRATEAYRERKLLVDASFERDALRQEASAPADGGGAMLGLDGGLRGLVPQLDALAKSPSPVVIYGESGSGRAMAARELHRRSARAQGPFVLVRCGGGRGDLAQRLDGKSASEPGALRRARHGTLHLGDIDALAPLEQKRLLAVVNDANDSNDAGAPRIIASARVSIDAEVVRGRFDRDLATQLKVHILEVPPLRKHVEDVPLLAAHFLAFQNERLGKQLRASPDALAALRGYDWPGNVRELRNLIERAAVLADGDTQLEREDFILQLEELPPSVTERPSTASVGPGSVYEEIGREEGDRLRSILKQALGNKAKAARLLGIARTTLNDRLRKYGID